MKHLNPIFASLGLSMEDVDNGKIFKEHEHEIYVLIEDFDQLKEAKSVDRQEQWTLKVAKTDKNGARGNIRIRKITKRPPYGEEATADAPVQYVYNIKANMADGSRLEVPLPASEDSFKVFKALAENGMIKDRYHFPDKESGLVFEVDMFLDPEGNYYPWAKIDIEVKDINAEVPPLPILVKEKIMGDTKDPAEKERITELYDKYFLTPSPYVKKD